MKRASPNGNRRRMHGSLELRWLMSEKEQHVTQQQPSKNSLQLSYDQAVVLTLACHNGRVKRLHLRPAPSTIPFRLAALHLHANSAKTLRHNWGDDDVDSPIAYADRERRQQQQWQMVSTAVAQRRPSRCHLCATCDSRLSMARSRVSNWVQRILRLCELRWLLSVLLLLLLLVRCGEI